MTRLTRAAVAAISVAGNAIDPSDHGGRVERRGVDARGFHQPDGMASCSVGGQTFIVLANEGGSRADEQDQARASVVDLIAAGAGDLSPEG